MPDILDVVANNVQLATLFSNYMRHITEQFVQFSNALFNVANLGLAFDNQGFLEVHFILVRKTWLLLQLLLLLLLLSFLVSWRNPSFIHGRARSHSRCSLLFQSATLNGLELIQRAFEFS